MSEYAPFEWQRAMLRLAKEHGWNGEEPSVLGAHSAHKQVYLAVQFLLKHSLITTDDCGIGLARVR